ncbi:DEAD-box ATP-dependent RNA helicase [Musa troglodytarum]|uniref:DEAD-box ATP-dependent RNA helicase n=1 Tax=Musa troglodytarum TaxID=320322 RepID=A0A9E7HAV7_9LILI|nr:DEAD-box ATP-dependent RNA helicase [Musa troglodytarum]
MPCLLIQDMALNLSSKLLPQRSMVSQNGSVADLVLTCPESPFRDKKTTSAAAYQTKLLGSVIIIQHSEYLLFGGEGEGRTIPGRGSLLNIAHLPLTMLA